MGDLNSDLLRSDYYSLHLQLLICENSLYLVPSGASHYTEHVDTWLDVVLLDRTEKLLSFEKSDAPLFAGMTTLFLIISSNPKQSSIER